MRSSVIAQNLAYLVKYGPPLEIYQGENLMLIDLYISKKDTHVLYYNFEKTGSLHKTIENQTICTIFSHISYNCKSYVI